jgi:dihydrofolate reductase
MGLHPSEIFCILAVTRFSHSYLAIQKEGLIDEVQLRVIPTTLGKGKPVFDRAYDMEFLGAKTYDQGLVLLRYKLDS